MTFSNHAAGLGGAHSRHTHAHAHHRLLQHNWSQRVLLWQPSRHPEYWTGTNNELSCPRYNTREETKLASRGVRTPRLNREPATQDPDSRTDTRSCPRTQFRSSLTACRMEHLKSWRHSAILKHWLPAVFN